MKGGRRTVPGLLGGLLLAGTCLGLVACGATSAAPAKPPSATEILAKPEGSGLTSAHFTLSTAFPVASGVTVNATGDGVIVYKPQPASRITIQAAVGGISLTVVILSVGGNDYTMTTPGNGKWISASSTSNAATLTDSTGATYVGEETVAQGKAWHVKAKDKQGNPFDVWIRESDGYPLKYNTTQASGTGTFSLTFDTYNTGEAITAPPAAQVQPSQ